MTKEIIEVPASNNGGGYCGYWKYMGCTTDCNVSVASQWNGLLEDEAIEGLFSYCLSAKKGGIDPDNAETFNPKRVECFGHLTDQQLAKITCGSNDAAPSVTEARSAMAWTGRASSGVDYVPQMKQVVVFPGGQPNVTHTVSLRIDNIYEIIDEKFALLIQNTNPSAVKLGDIQLATVTIVDETTLDFL